MEYIAAGSPDLELDAQVGELVHRFVQQLGAVQRVLLIPPDVTRFHSGAGPLTSCLWQELHHQADVWVLPAVGTHTPMTEAEASRMYPGVPFSRFRVHDFRRGVRTLGEVPAEYVKEVSGGLFAQ